MNIGKRSRFSLCQLLDELGRAQASFLLRKHDVTTEEPWRGPFLGWLEEVLLRANNESLGSLLEELVRTHHAVWESTGWGYRAFDQRWDDLLRCLELNGYRVDRNQLIQIEPVIEGQEPMEDDLTKAMRKSGLPQAAEVEQKLNASAEAFRSSDSDRYNDCLTNARIALETLAKAIAAQRHADRSDTYTPNGWGSALAYLHTAELISERQEKGLAGVYSLISEGAHVPLGFTEEEFVRFGRNLAVSMCYFLVKRYLGN